MRTLTIALALYIAAACQAADAPGAASDPAAPAALTATAARTAEKLRSTPAAWTATIALGGDAALTVDVLHAPPNRRYVYRIRPNATAMPVEVTRVIETPGAWYVSQWNRRTKSRPFEAEFDLPAVSLARALAEPRLPIDPDVAARLGRFTARDGDLARYATPVDNPDAARNLIAQIEAAQRDNPKVAADPTVQNQLAQARRMLADGVPIAVDVRTGIMTEYATARLPVRLSDFRFDPAPAPAEFDTAAQTWQDLTDDPTVSIKPDDRVIISHFAAWRPGQPGKDTECLLLDLATGRARRLPYNGPAATGGCFVRDRASVVVCGMADLQNNLAPYEIDLKTGANRRLGGDALAAGFTLDPVLSPDGKVIAAMHKSGIQGVLDVEVVLIDLATDRVKRIGKPFDGAFVNWLPDGSGLIVMRRDPAPGAGPAGRTVDVICRMGLDGALTPLRNGREPVVVPGGIAFEDPGDRLWHQCDLDGKNPRLIGDGLPRHGFASASPDGKRLIMMAFGGAAGPRPVIVDLATGTARPVDVGPGLWAVPAWR